MTNYTLNDLSIDFYEKALINKKEIFKLQIYQAEKINNNLKITFSNGRYFKSFEVKDNIKFYFIQNIDELKFNICNVRFDSKGDKYIINFMELLNKIEYLIGNPKPHLFYKSNITNEFINLENFINISDLSLLSKNFIINIRCSKKFPIKIFGSDKKKWFIANFIDETGFIQGIFFNEVIEKFYDKLDESQTYQIKNVEVKTDFKNNNSKNKNQLFFNLNSSIIKIKDDKTIPYIYSNLVKLEELKLKEENEIIDILCFVEQLYNIEKVLSKNNENIFKRTIKVKDDTKNFVYIIIWGEKLSKLSLEINEIYMFTNLKIKKWNGSQLHTCFDSEIMKDLPKSNERYKELLNLKQLIIKSKSENLLNLKLKIDEFIPLQIVIDKTNVLLEKNDFKTKLYFDCLIYITYLRERFYYNSCINDYCRKKVINENKNIWVCTKCKKSFDKPKARYIALIKIVDDSSYLFSSINNDNASINIFGIDCNKLMNMYFSDKMEYNSYIQSRFSKNFIVKIQSKLETNDSQTIVKHNIIQAINSNDTNSTDLININLNSINKYKEKIKNYN